MRISSKFFLLIACFSLAYTSHAQFWKRKQPDLIHALNSSNHWADSVYDALTPEQRIAQLFMIAAYSNVKDSFEVRIDTLVKNYNIGGLIFMQGTCERQGAMTNYYQKTAKTPMLIAMDAEWGLGMRLQGVKDFPKAMALGAVADEQYAYELGKQIGNQCKLLGVHINFAPDVDVNNNPENPVINFRSFGEEKENVVRKAIAFQRGLQEVHVMACAKHFPGHGDTNTDSHENLPSISVSRARLDSLELYPFKVAIKKGVGSVMVAHLFVPVLLDSPGLPTTLSGKAINQLLKDDLGFRGLVFTDALNMKGIANNFQPGDIEVRALKAGIDVLLFSQNVPLAIQRISQAIECDELSKSDIERSVKKILRMKYWAGLYNFTPIDTTNLTQRVQPESSRVLAQKIYEESITLLKNEGDKLPLKTGNQENSLWISIGNSGAGEMGKTLSFFSRMQFANMPLKADSSLSDSLMKRALAAQNLVISIHPSNPYPTKKFGMNDPMIKWVDSVCQARPTTVYLLGNAYGVKYFESAKALVVAYENNELTQLTAIQSAFGAIPFKGSLPVSAGKYPACSGICTRPLDIPAFANPKAVGLDDQLTKKLDSIVRWAIQQKAMPGCQLYVSVGNKVVHYKAYGYFSEDKSRPVTLNDVYDLASITKVAASGISMMHFYEQKRFTLKDSLGMHLSYLRGSNKSNLKISEVFTHQAGLIPFIPFHTYFTKKDQMGPKVFSNIDSAQFKIRIAQNFYGDTLIQAFMRDSILVSPLRTRGNYEYSDLGYSFARTMMEGWAGNSLMEITDSLWYQPLGLSTMGYLPQRKFARTQMAPTENDKLFRMQVVQGDVHDQNASLWGGIAGHAGLFSSANDLGRLFYMLNNGGKYGDSAYLQSSTIKFFNTPYYLGNRRAIFFDKPDTTGKISPCSKYAPPTTFGHTGFTGTCVWADPENNVVFVFVSNRTYPIAETNRLVALNVRTLLQDAVYEALIRSDQYVLRKYEPVELVPTPSKKKSTK